MKCGVETPVSRVPFSLSVVFVRLGGVIPLARLSESAAFPNFLCKLSMPLLPLFKPWLCGMVALGVAGRDSKEKSVRFTSVGFRANGAPTLLYGRSGCLE